MKKDKNIVEITTPSGFTCSINGDKFDDWAFVEMLSSDDEMSGHKMCVFVVNNVLSQEDAAKLKEMCKKPDGAVSSSKMESIITEIMTAYGEQVKN